jgi:serine phosphatase RsbU (regulator of sigma subunit)
MEDRMDHGAAVLVGPRVAPVPRLPGSGRFSWTTAAKAAAAGLAAFGVGNLAQSTIISAVHGNRSELEWLSDAIISTAVAGIAFLWLHLKASRLRVLALERDQIAVDEQLRLAAEIQRNLLPPIPKVTPGFRWAARMVPAGRIGGDFYDFLWFGDGRVLAILGDVSGKGIAAALLLSSLKTLFRTVARETDDPAAIAERISAALHEEYGGLPYMTAIVARFESSGRRIGYVNAGHPSGYVLREGEVSAELASGGLPLGLLPGARYTRSDVAIQPGDVGVLVTDGVTEALETGPVKLSDALRALRARRAPGDLCDELLRTAAEGTGPVGAEGWQDDRTALVFAVEPIA